MVRGRGSGRERKRDEGEESREGKRREVGGGRIERDRRRGWGGVLMGRKTGRCKKIKRLGGEGTEKQKKAIRPVVSFNQHESKNLYQIVSFSAG